jgi:hypothetical protein
MLSDRGRYASVLCEYKAVLVTCLTFFKWSEDVVPTVAFNFRKVRKGNVVLKIWDVAGTRMARQFLFCRL